MDSIRANAPDAIPNASMRTLWRLLLSGRVKLVGQELDLYGWRMRLVRNGMTITSRLELREMLTPRVSLREPFPWPFDNDEDDEVPVRIRRLVDWEIVLSAEHVHASLRDPDGTENWRAALLTDFTGLLRDALDLMRELGGADERRDLSYSSQPSISGHPQNSAFRDWTALVDLNRDAWLATVAESPERARLAAEAWSEIPYPLFHRLAFFAAAQDDVVPCGQGLGWLLAVLHLRDLRVRVLRRFPLLVRRFLVLPRTVEPSQLRPRQRLNTRRLRQPPNERLVGFSRVPPLDTPHRRVRFQRRRVNADRLPPNQTRCGQPLQNPREHCLMGLYVDPPPRARQRRVIRRRRGQLQVQERPQTQRIGHPPRNPPLRRQTLDDGWWLWSIETQRETMRLLVALAPRFDDGGLERLERAILAGPPREMYREDIEEERWLLIQERDIWLRLAKVSQAGAELSAAARERLEGLAVRHPDWQLAENERDEFPTWTGDGNELPVHVTTPRDRDELIEWLRQHPEPDEWRPDDWHARCRDDFGAAASALTALAAEGRWPTGRWREALHRWSEDELTERSWREMAPVLADLPTGALQDLTHEVSRWLEKLGGSVQGQEAIFLSLCDRVLALDYDIDEAGDDLVGHAINQPVGHVTEALLRWWYKHDLGDETGLTDGPRQRFTQLCDTETPKFRDGRVLLAAHVISLFQVDRDWAMQFLLPLFEWDYAEVEARSAWEGFLWSPRPYRPLMEVLKPAFLDTANHYAQLGRHRDLGGHPNPAISGQLKTGHFG